MIIWAEKITGEQHRFINESANKILKKLKALI